MRYQSFNSIRPSDFLLNYATLENSYLRLKTYQYPSISFKRVSTAFRNFQESIRSVITPSEYKIFCVMSKEISLDLTKRLQEFEQEIYYSYSDQCFKIEHGKGNPKGYCGFFDALSESGSVYFYIAQCKKDKKITKIVKGEEKVFFRKKGEIAAVGCCVLRTLKARNGDPTKAWYVCDLKVGENHRGEHLPTTLIKKGAWRFLQCKRAFGVCMDELNGKMSKSARVSTQHSFFSGLLETTHFNRYKLSAQQVQDHYKAIQEKFCKSRFMKKEYLSFVSNEGLKDYQVINRKTGASKPMKLLHAKPSSKEQNMPQEGYDHVFSAVKGSSLDITLQKIAEPSLTGRFVSFGMKEIDFNQITSAEI